jgi:hypothetical protein
MSRLLDELYAFLVLLNLLVVEDCGEYQDQAEDKL